MISFFPATALPKDRIQSHLLRLASLFLFLNAVVLTLSPSVRLRSWDVDYRWAHWLGFLVWLVGFSLIHHLFSKLIPERDPYILPICALLSGWGLLTIWRLDNNFGWRQTLWLAICLFAIWGGLKIPNLLILLRRYKYLWLTSGLLLTALTFFFGTYPEGIGPRLWLGCCGIYLQPSEPLKLLLIIYLAAYLADRLPISFNLAQLLIPTLVLVGAALLILLAQRDLGTASLFLILYFLIIYLASGSWRVLLIGLAIIMIAGVAGYLMFDVIRLRVEAWLNPWLDPSGRSYQIVQSILAMATGRVLGRGLGLGNPALVPISHSDFIFSAIAEENGLTGSLGILLLLGILTTRGILIALKAPNNYQRYLASGLSAYLATQSVLIIGGTNRLFPLTGVTLPFVSYGGSSLLTAFLSILILSQISNHSEMQPAPLPQNHPYLILGAAILTTLAMLGLVNGWWSVVRADDLLGRQDNLRRSIAGLYVKRGAILDRNNRPISISVGEPGEYKRQILYPALSHVTGYTHPVYGQAGVERSLDGYLSGLQGLPASTVWLNEMIYGTPPPGLDVRLSIDLTLQEKADKLLANHSGALVLLNAETGEILAMASHPFYDANKVEEKLEEWLHDTHSPLVNRATQGQYPPGTAFGPFLFAEILDRRLPLEPPQELTTRLNGSLWGCSLTTNEKNEWGTIIGNGCPGALLDLGQNLQPSQLLDLYKKLGWLEPPSIQLPVASSSSIDAFSDPQLAILGQSETRISPLQMALAAALLSAQGNLSKPLLINAINTPQEGWVILGTSSQSPVFSEKAAFDTTHYLGYPNLPIWQAVGRARTDFGVITWYIGGTRAEWKGIPIALAVLLEEDNPAKIEQIGHQMLKDTIIH